MARKSRGRSGPAGTFGGQVGVITGAGSGIGRAIALRWAELGGTPWLIGRDQRKLEATARRVADAGRTARVRACDLSDPDDLERAARELRDELRRVHLLVHSASSWSSSSFEELPARQLDEQYAVGVRAPVELTRILLPRLIAGRGQVVFVNSSAALGAAMGLTAYGSMKRALSGVADHLRAELNPRGVRVLGVYPGRTATPMQRRVHEHEGRSYVPGRLLQPEDVASIVLHALSLPRTAEVTEIHVRSMRPLDPLARSRSTRR